MQVIYLDDMQVVDALVLTQPEQPQDVTPYTEQVAHVPVGRPEQIAVVLAYAYYRVPVTRISFEPDLLSYDPETEPAPKITDVKVIDDTVTGKSIGVSFNVLAGAVGTWTANLQVECIYTRDGSTYTHRRTASFFVSSQRPIDEVLEELQ